MEQLSARLLLTAGILLLIAEVIFAILQVWLYTGLLWAGAFEIGRASCRERV